MTSAIATSPRFRFFTNSGAPAANCLLHTYGAGTLVPKTTWKDQGQTTTNTNPIVLDANGECLLWLDAVQEYKFVLTTSTGSVISTTDDISGNNGLLRSDLSSQSGSSLVGFIQSGTGSVPRTMQDKAREALSVSDKGQVNDGITDATTAVQNALNTAFSAGGGVVLLPPGIYKITDPLVIPDGVTLRGAGKQKSILSSGALTYVLQASGSLSGTSHTLAANAAKDSRTIVLSAGGGAAYQVGDYALLQAENLPFAGALATQKQAEFVRVESIATDTLTIRGSLAFSYTTANTAKLTKLNPVRDFAIEDLGITSEDPVNFARIFCDFEYCQDFAIRRCHFYNGKNSAIYLLGCVNAEVEDVTGRDLYSDPTFPGAFGYLVCEAGPNLGLKMRNSSGESVRHVYTTVVGGGTATVQPYGYPMFSKISNCDGLWTYEAAFDTHPGAGFGIEFDVCTARKSNSTGFQIRSENTHVKSPLVYGAVGAAISVTNYGSNSSVVDPYSEDVCTGTDPNGTDWTSKGAYSDNSQNTIWKDPVAKNCGGPAFEQVRGGGGGDVIGLRAINPCRIDATVKAGVVITGAAGGTVLIDDPIITCSDTRMDYGILSANANPQILVNGDYITGSQVARYSIASATSLILSSMRSSAINTYGLAEVLTIATGVITVANLGSGYVVVAGEGGAADDLTTINGGADGNMILLRKSSATITVKHGTGNIQLTGNADMSLVNSLSILTLVRIGAQWVEVARRT